MKLSIHLVVNAGLLDRFIYVVVRTYIQNIVEGLGKRHSYTFFNTILYQFMS